MSVHDFDVERLVLDAAPLLSTAATSSSPSSSLRGIAKNFITTPDVIAEIRDKTSRDLLATTLQVLGLDDSAEGSTEIGGLQVNEPNYEAIAKVSNFARLTGDIAVLSQADIRVLALTYALEVEYNGTRRLRDAPGQLSEEEKDREAKRQERLATKATVVPSAVALEPVAFPQNTQVDTLITTVADAEHSMERDSEQDSANEIRGEADPRSNDGQAVNEAEQDEESDGGEWITPKNVALHQSRDLGLFPTLPASTADGLLANGKARKAKTRTALKVACLTGDFAMQNVALQMGLNVFGVGGKKVKEVKTWILRCHACFKLCKDPTKKFCPSCGNPSLLRTSITYVQPTSDNPKGYILHLKQNFQYKLRGTQFSIPNPRPGSSNALKNAANAELILREDQKEWQRGVKRADIAKNKQERAAAKSLRDGRGNAAFGGMNLDDPDWLPGMLSGDGGKGPAGVRLGKDGLPLIGFGKRNPNEARRKR